MLGLHWRRGNGVAVISSFVVGIATLIFWKQLPFGQSMHQVFPAMLLSTAVFAILALYGRINEAREVQILFAERSPRDRAIERKMGEWAPSDAPPAHPRAGADCRNP